MTWCGIEGHDEVVHRFRCSVRQGRLPSTFLFVGPAGIGKRLFALRLAQGLLCQRVPAVDLAPCGECAVCQQIAARSHPDVEFICRPEDKSFIPLETFIGDREHRSREGLCHWISLKPSQGGRRIAIIDDADYLNQEGANCLLKTLEEPPPRSILILIGTSVQRQLPTIRSRCQIVRFGALDDAVLRRLLPKFERAPAERLEELIELAEGSLDRAHEFADPDLAEFATRLLERWCASQRESWTLAKEIHTFAEAGGRDAPAKRARLRRVIELLIRRLRLKLREQLPTGDRPPHDLAPERFRDLETTLAQLDRCLLAQQQLDSFANLATLIEAWIDELFQLELR